MASKRRNIINWLVTQLKLINGGVSSLNPSYTYSTNLFNNVFRRNKFIDEVNDFPSLYLYPSLELRNYNTVGANEAALNITIRCYVRIENSQQYFDGLFSDIEHILEYATDNQLYEIKQIVINSIDTDEGLTDPTGIGEIFITIYYEL